MKPPTWLRSCSGVKETKAFPFMICLCLSKQKGRVRLVKHDGVIRLCWLDEDVLFVATYETRVEAPALRLPPDLGPRDLSPRPRLHVAVSLVCKRNRFVDWLWSGQQHQLLSQPIFHPQDHPHLTHTVHLIHTSHTHFFRNKKNVDWLRSGQQHQLFSQHIFHLQDHPHLTHTSSTYTYIYTYIYTLHQHFTYMSATPHPHFINTSHPHFNNA